jgi:hypothetical protein
MGTVLLGERELVLADVQCDHPGRRELTEKLNGDVPKATGTDDHRGRSTDQSRQDALDGLVRREGRVGEGGGADWVEVLDGHEVAGAVDDHVLRHRTVRPQTRRDHPVQAQVLAAVGTHLAHAAPPAAIHDDRLSDLHATGALPQRLDDAGRLVAQRHRHRVGVALLGHGHDELVGVTQSRRRDPEQDLAWSRGRPVDLDEFFRVPNAVY